MRYYKYFKIFSHIVRDSKNHNKIYPMTLDEFLEMEYNGRKIKSYLSKIPYLKEDEKNVEFFVLSEHEVTLPRWIRLGKWMAKARVDVQERGVAQVKHGDFHATGALNPLDISLTPENCSIVAMAPASLITHVYGSGDYYEFQYGEGKHAPTVHLPVGMSYQPGRKVRSST